jgi:hypothetical protein
MKSRSFVYQKIENALQQLYDFASQREFDKSCDETNRISSLQESLETTALELEKTERPILHQNQIRIESRLANKCIIGPHAVTLAALLHRITPEKLTEYQKYPLAHRIGFIHMIPESEFNINNVTILDVNFLGLFPKAILQQLYRYARQVESMGHDKEEFLSLVNDLIHAFIYRPILIQKVIHIMLVKQKKEICDFKPPYTEPTENDDESTNYASRNNMMANRSNNTPSSPLHPLEQICHANKCRLLRAKGILRRPMLCSPGKNMCSGCANEASRHRRIQQIELEIIGNCSPNETWKEVFQLVISSTPTNLKHLRHLMQHIPTFMNTKRDDHIFGATRYLANSLGIMLTDHSNSDLIDQSMSAIDRKQLWRNATFHCRCNPNTTLNYQIWGPRTFCPTCNLLVQVERNIGQKKMMLCPVCYANDSWKTENHPCLACQFACVIYRNPFNLRFERSLNNFLNIDESEESEASPKIPHQPQTYDLSISPSQDLLSRRDRSLKHSFQEISNRATPEQRKCVFENLRILQQSIRGKHSSNKRTIQSQDQNSKHLSTYEMALSPKKKNYSSGLNIHDESSQSSITTNTTLKYRAPLTNLDMNSLPSGSNETQSYYGIGIHKATKQERTKRAKEKHNLKKMQNQGKQNH